MKQIMAVLLCFHLFGLAQQSYISDDNFERALIDLGLDATRDNYVQESSIEKPSYLWVENKEISSLAVTVID